MKQKRKPMKTYVFDNEGRSYDNYTIVNKDGEVFGSSDNPFAPNGFGQYSGNVIELTEAEHALLFLDKNGGYRKDAIKKYKRQFVNNARKNPDWLGKEIKDFTKLPEDVQKYINQINSDEDES